MKESLTETN